MKNVGKLISFIDTELKSNMKDLVIAYDKNRYELFGKYRIDSSTTLTKVIDVTSMECNEFSSLKNAVVYCTLTDAGKYAESRRLQFIDLKLSSLQTDIQIHRKILKTSNDAESRCIYTTKLQEDSYKRKLLIEEINTYINSSKMILAAKLNRNFNLK